MLMRRLSTLVLILGIACPAGAQQLIGYVNTRDAEVTGASDVLNGQAVLVKSVGVTARDHTAPITLGRGGTVRVCQTSVLHVTESKSADVAAPLLFSLERGAVEIQMNSALNDAIMTPDLRFTIVNKGPLDLRLRVARNGDTCVESRGPFAPTLNISDAFGETMYQVAAGQHVLFEHGNLHEVVDKEQYPCGCPEPNGMSVADALLASGGTKTAVPLPAPASPQPIQASAPATAMLAVVPAPAPPVVRAAAPPTSVLQPDAQTDLRLAEQAAAAAAMRAAEAKHPFPVAISEGLESPAEFVPAAPGAPRAQITDSLSYNASVPLAATSAAAKGKKAAKVKAGAAASQAAAAKPGTAPEPAAKPSNDLAHVVGKFFRRLFGG
jgi:hypothetical protein